MYYVVGAGFSGATVARVLAEAGKRVTVLEQRDHVGGNAYDRWEGGGLVHQYGPHLFHTNSQRIFDFLSRFTEWTPYEHKVASFFNGRYYPMPINLNTVNQFYGGRCGADADALHFIEKARIPCEHPRNSEEAALAAVGPELTDAFLRGYSLKHWGMDLSELAPSVIGRVPFRADRDDRYFRDKFQSLPRDGYTELFHRMLNHRNIEVKLGTRWVQEYGDHLVYTGPIDAFFRYKYGPLPYRGVRFHFGTTPMPSVQSYSQINYPHNHGYTRSVDYSLITGAGMTVQEYPHNGGDPMYPIPTAANEGLYQRYKAEAEHAYCGIVTFVGRLAEYRYYNMDQAVGAALTAAKKILG